METQTNEGSTKDKSALPCGPGDNSTVIPPGEVSLVLSGAAVGLALGFALGALVGVRLAK